MDITKEQYEYALDRIEALLPMSVGEEVSPEVDAELSIMSDVVERYEAVHYPLDTLTLGELIKSALDECGMTQAQVARELGLSPSRVSDFVNDRGEPSLSVAGKLCKILGISPQVMLGLQM